MAGRFLAAPLFLSCFVLSAIPIKRQHSVYVLMATMLIGLSAHNNPILSATNHSLTGKELKKSFQFGISDEQQYYQQKGGLISVTRGDGLPGGSSRKKKLPESGEKLRVRVKSAVGYLGFNAGPEIHFIDALALCDPLLSRLPMEEDPNWRIGHFKRKIPAGYVESVETGERLLKDPDLQQFYDKLVIITREPLWSVERFQTIVNMNIGGYDHLIESYK